MKTEIKIQVRAYNVEIRDERTGEKKLDTIVLTKDQLKAAATLGINDESIICRLYNRQGYRVIGWADKPVKQEITIDLYDAYFHAVFPGLDEIEEHNEEITAETETNADPEADAI